MPLTGGWVTAGVVRVGGTVRRPPGPNDDFVRRLLAHLEQRDFHAAPRHLGRDDRGRTKLTYVEGCVPSDCRTLVLDDGALGAAARLLRLFHDATVGTPLAADREVVCHGDFGPWNLVWRHGSPVAIIDFDDARPGERLDDLGYAAWKHLNLGLVDLSPNEQARRLRVFAGAYGFEVDLALVEAIDAAQERMSRVVRRTAGGETARQAVSQLDAERAWLADSTPALLAASTRQV